MCNSLVSFAIVFDGSGSWVGVGATKYRPRSQWDVPDFALVPGPPENHTEGMILYRVKRRDTYLVDPILRMYITRFVYARYGI
jgi:hypothetical protein